MYANINNFCVQSLSRVQLFVTSMECSMLGSPVLHYIPEFAQTHVHWVGDAIQPSHPLLPPPPPAFSLSQHQGLFQWVGSLHQVAKVLGVPASASVLPMKIQGWFNFKWINFLILRFLVVLNLSTGFLLSHYFFGYCSSFTLRRKAHVLPNQSLTMGHLLYSKIWIQTKEQCEICRVMC